MLPKLLADLLPEILIELVVNSQLYLEWQGRIFSMPRYNLPYVKVRGHPGRLD
jgi:hypothetical protein